MTNKYLSGHLLRLSSYELINLVIMSLMSESNFKRPNRALVSDQSNTSTDYLSYVIRLSLNPPIPNLFRA